MRKIKVGSDFSGVGAFDYAIKRVAEAKGFESETVYACDKDKFARLTYENNHGTPPYYPQDVYDREIPTDPLDIYMTSPPCQSFSVAGNRKGKRDKRGVLFFNSLEFIEKNKPRFFIFENVKGLISDDNGKTFQEWVNSLGGKSVNGLPMLFPCEDSVPYHLYYQVLNSKKHGVPQNRERIFLIGVRDDKDNFFRFPKEEYLQKKIVNILENDVKKKFYLKKEVVQTLFYDMDLSRSGIKVKSANSKGFSVAKEGDSVNFCNLKSETNRGRVGKEGICNTLDTACTQAVILGYSRDKNGKVVSRNIKNEANTIHCSTGNGGNTDQFIADYRTDEGLRVRADGCSPCLQAVMTDEFNKNSGRNPPLIGSDLKIRRLTPRECFRLQDFPDSFDFSCVSDSQAYKQAGNSITVRVLEKILLNLQL